MRFRTPDKTFGSDGVIRSASGRRLATAAGLAHRRGGHSHGRRSQRWQDSPDALQPRRASGTEEV